MATSGGAAALNLSVLISAQNTASPEFQKVQKDAQDTQKVLQETGKAVAASGSAGMQDLAKHTELTGRSLREVIGPLKLFSENIAQQVSPALSGMVTGLGAATREGAKFSLSVSASIIALATIGAGVALYIERLNALTHAQAEANFAVRAFDAAGLRGQLDATAKAVEEFSLSWKQKFLSNFGQTGAPDWFSALVGKPDPRIFELQKSALEASLPLERALQAAQQQVSRGQGLGMQAIGRSSRAEAVGELHLFIAAEVDLAAAINLESDALIRVINLEAERARAEAERRGTLGIEAQGIETVRAGRLRGVGTQRETRLDALGFDRATRELRMSARTGIPESFAGSEEDLALKAGVLFAQDSANRRGANDAALVSAQAQALTQIVGLTRQQRVEAELVSIEAARQVGLAQAKGKLDEDQLTTLADLQAQMKTQLALQQEMARLDPVMGFRIGIQEVVDEFTSAGELMRSGIHQLGNDMSRSFSETFTSVVMGDFKKLADLPSAFAKSMLSAFSDMVSKMVVGNIFAGIQRQFGLSAFLPGAGAMAGGGGGGGGGGLIEVGGQLFRSVQAGGGQTVLVPVGATGMSGGGINLAGVPLPPGTFLTGGSSTINAISGMTLGDIATYGFAGAYAESQAVLAAGSYAARAAQLGELGINTASSASSAGASLTLGTFVGGSLAALGLGLTIYSALQGPPTWQNIVISAASGAASGAAIGFYVSTALGYADFGVATAIGAIVGALLGGGAASFGKEPKKPSAAERSFQAGQAGRAALSSAIANSTSLEELRSILNAKWTPYNEVVIVSYDRPTHWVGSWTNGSANFLAYPQAGIPYPDIGIMLTDSRFIDNLEIQVAGTPGGGSAAYDMEITSQFQDKWNTLLLALAKGKFGFREDFGPLGDLIGAAPSATGFASVERLTVLSGNQFGRGVGQQLEISPDVLRAAGLTDDQIEQFLRLAFQVDLDRDLNILVRPEEFAF